MSDREVEQLRSVLRAWTKRPPERSASVARTRVLAEIGRQRKSAAWRWMAGAVAAGGLAAIVLFSNPPWATVQPAMTSVAATSSKPSAPPMMVLELDSGTTLYFTRSKASVPVVDELNPENEKGEES